MWLWLHMRAFTWITPREIHKKDSESRLGDEFSHSRFHSGEAATGSACPCGTPAPSVRAAPASPGPAARGLPRAAGSLAKNRSSTLRSTASSFVLGMHRSWLTLRARARSAAVCRCLGWRSWVAMAVSVVRYRLDIRRPSGTAGMLIDVEMVMHVGQRYFMASCSQQDMHRLWLQASKRTGRW